MIRQAVSGDKMHVHYIQINKTLDAYFKIIASMSHFDKYAN